MKRAEWRQMERCQSIHIELILGGRASFLRTRYCVTSLTVSAAFSSLPTTLLFHEQLIGVTPSPAFPWFNRADDGMGGRAKVFRGVFVLRGIAAADVPAGEAHSQMDPSVLHFQTLLAAGGARLDVADLIEMGASCLWHDRSPLFLHFFEVFMHELDGHRAFADGRGDALDRIGSHVSRGEYAWTAGLQQERLPGGTPMRRLRQNRAGPDKPLVVPFDLCG